MTHEVKEPVVGETVGVYFGPHYEKGKVLHFSETAIVLCTAIPGAGQERTVSINNAAVIAIVQFPGLPIEEEVEEEEEEDAARACKKPEPSVRHTSCQYCLLDIEGVHPFRRGTWRDRGNNTTCSSGPYVGGNHSPG